MIRSRTRWARLAALAAAGALALTACGGDDDDDDDAAAQPETGTEPVTLTLAFWGDFGFDEVQEAYKEYAPNVTLSLNEGEYNAQHQDLQTKITAGSGVADIAAIDEGFIVQFKNQADKFVNLLDIGAADYESAYLPWKWQGSLGPDGQQIGLGTDVGGLAMCYRRDLFEAAGLPTERDEVSALWPDWDAFIETGQTYVEGAAGKKFVDNATQIMNPVLGQQAVGYFTTEEELAMDGGPKVAFDTAVAVADAGLSADLPVFQPEWNAGFTNGDFAVLACPAWMQGYIQDQAPDLAGEWDIADVPGGGGNWGGSWLTIPAASENQAEAWKFLEWFIQPEQQLEVFNTVGNLPSQPGMYTDPALLAKTNPFFNEAPVGEIFTSAAEGLEPQYFGRLNGPVRQAVENVLNAYQDGSFGSTDEAWQAAVDAAEQVVEEDQG